MSDEALPDAIDEALAEAATTPATAAQDGRSATARSIPDLIALQKHQRANEAAEAGLGGLVTHVLKSPSALG